MKFTKKTLIKTSKRKHLKGGNKSFLTPPPHIEQPLKYGASTPSEEAFLHQQHMNQNQQRMLNGEPPVHQTQTQTQTQVGGVQGIVVPQVQTPLPSMPNDANSISVDANKTLTQQGANAVMDSCVGQGNTCTVQNAWDGKGGKRRSRKTRHTKRGGKSRSRKTRHNKKLNKKSGKRSMKQHRRNKTRKYT
jgi:hypothetical protein